jgi:1-acyl-sn-glycerol-3-phosphate acyltransferase
MPRTIYNTPILRPLICWLAKLGFRLTGWQLVGQLPAEKKYVIIVAPHTSNWDFLLGLCFVFLHQIKLTFMAKHTIFAFPFGGLIRWLGGMPIVRSSHSNVVDATAQAFRDSTDLVVAMSPEGTRKKAERWKSGFYWMACKGEVPIVIGFIDYRTRQVGLCGIFYPTGDIDADMPKIQAFYRDTARPERTRGGPLTARASASRGARAASELAPRAGPAFTRRRSARSADLLAAGQSWCALQVRLQAAPGLPHCRENKVVGRTSVRRGA